MAIFGKKKDKEQKNQAVEKEGFDKKVKKTTSSEVVSSYSVEAIIKHPRITEKATDVAEDYNVYTFDVSKKATKQEVAKAIKAIYKVEPVKVRTVSIPRKPVAVRGVKNSFKPGGKKAYVYLKKGDSIEFV